MPLTMLGAYAPFEMPSLCAAANGHGELTEQRRLILQEWFDMARTWPKQRRQPKSDMLNELSQATSHLRVSLSINDEGARGPASKDEEAAWFGLPVNTRLRRLKRPRKYVETWLQWGTGRGRRDLIEVGAVYTLWLLDRPDMQKRLKRCAHPTCAQLFWDTSPTRPDQYCSAQCRNRRNQERYRAKHK